MKSQIRNRRNKLSIKVGIIVSVFCMLTANAKAQYTPLTISISISSGYNEDVIANGTGTAESSTSNDVDGGGFAFFANSFSPNGLPNDGVISSAITTGLTYQLADYASNNDLRLSNNSSGTLNLVAPQEAQELYILAVSGTGSSTMDVTITFSDNTTQTANEITVADWYGGGNVALTDFERVDLNNDNTGSGSNGPNLYQYSIPITAGNQSKTIQDINFSHASGSGILNIFAVSAEDVTTPCSTDPVTNTAGDHGEDFTTTNGSSNFSDNNNGTVPSSYRDFYNTYSVTQTSGGSFDFSVNFKGNNVDYGVWIDWNQDGIFDNDDATEREFYQFSGTLNPTFSGTINIPSGTSAGDYRMRVRGAYTNGAGEIDPCATYGWGETRDYKLIVIETNCSGTPTGGTTVLSPNSGGVGSTVNGSVTGATNASDLTYQWQYSDDGNAPWTDIAGETNATLSTTAISTIGTRDYRRAVTCNGNTAYSSPATYTTHDVTYCTPEGTNSNRYINDFTTTGGNQDIDNSGSGFSTDGYGDFYATHEVVLDPGASFDFNANFEGGTAGFRIWIDSDHDGTFDPTTEVAYNSTSYENNHSGTITMPTAGEYRMRVVSHWFNIEGDTPPCETGFEYGEFEDYKIRVIDPQPCTGTPSPGITLLSPSSGLVSSPVNGSVTGATIATGFNYQWQYYDGINWVDITGETGTTLSTTARSDIGTRDYRRAMTCSNAGSTVYSDPATYTTHEPIYCEPGGDFPLEDIQVYIINFSTSSGGGQNISNPTGYSTDGYEDFSSEEEVSREPNQTFTFNTELAEDVININNIEFRIWIDWNQDGVFDLTAEEVATATGGISHSGTITVPTSTPPGEYQMRVFTSNSSFNTEPCDPLMNGEVEDYKIRVVTPFSGPGMEPICEEGTSDPLGGNLDGSNTAVWSSSAGGTFTNNGGTTPGTATWTAPAGYTGVATLTLTGASPARTESKTIKVTSQPNISATLSKTDPDCPDDGDLTVTANTFWYKDDYSSGTPQVGEKTTNSDAIIESSNMRLTGGVTEATGIMNVLNPGFNESHIKANFKMYIGGGGDEGADGIKVSYGSLTIEFDTYLNSNHLMETCSPEADGPNKKTAISIQYNGHVLLCNLQEIRDSWQDIEIFVDQSNILTLTVDGSTYTQDLSTTNYPTANKSEWEWSFLGRTGSNSDEHRIDDVTIEIFKDFEYSLDNNNWEDNPTFTDLDAGTYTVYMREKSPCYCSASTVVGTIILEEQGTIPSATLTTSNASICHGNNVQLTGTISDATGNWTMDVETTPNVGTVTVTGTGSGSWTEEITPSENTTYSIASIDDGCAGTGTGSTAITLPTAGTTLAQNNESATCTVKDGERVHFYHSSGRLITSVEATSGDLGSVTATAYVDGAPQLSTACDIPSYVTSVMQRHWVITPTSNNAASVYLPFKDTEYTALESASIANSNPDDDLSAISGLMLSKYSDPNNVNEDWEDNCTSQGGNQNATIHGNNGNGNVTPGNNFVNPISNAQFAQYNITGFSEFWLHGQTVNSALPVELTNFSASCDENVTLNWTTASEHNSDYFIVEKSRDGYNWTFVGEQNAAGNSNSELHYNQIDQNRKNGISYY